MADCEHSQHWSLATCPGLTPEEQAYGEKVRSVGWTFGGGRQMFHGDFGTIKEQTDEIMRNAKKNGQEPPEYVGPRSKMRSMESIVNETLAESPGLYDAVRDESERSTGTTEGTVESSMAEVS